MIQVDDTNPTTMCLKMCQPPKKRELKMHFLFSEKMVHKSRQLSAIFHFTYWCLLHERGHQNEQKRGLWCKGKGL